MNRNLDICVGCENFEVREVIRFDINPLPVDKPTSGDGRYIRCGLYAEPCIHLESRLVLADSRARHKFEKRIVFASCPRHAEQQVCEWNKCDHEAQTRDL